VPLLLIVSSKKSRLFIETSRISSTDLIDGPDGLLVSKTSRMASSINAKDILGTYDTFSLNFLMLMTLGRLKISPKLAF
jgi:hypothetical protein